MHLWDNSYLFGTLDFPPFRELLLHRFEIHPFNDFHRSHNYQYFLVVNHIIQKIRTNRIYGFENRFSNVKFIAGALIFVDVLLLLIFYSLEMYTLIFSIIIVEILIAAMGALSVWMIVYSVETWFDYIG